MNISSVKESVLNILFTKRCKYCGDIIVPQNEICPSCRDSLPKIEEPICVLCGHAKADCKCKKHKNEYRAVIAPFYYEGGIKKAIHRFKFDARDYVGDTLALDMSEAVMREYSGVMFDFITFVPFSKAEKKSREFNQSELLANRLSQNLNIPAADVLVKLYETPPQHTLKQKERRGNVFGIYDVKPECSVSGKTVLLVDDIKTTGATLSECAKMLKLAGADTVYCICAAITKMAKI